MLVPCRIRSTSFGSRKKGKFVFNSRKFEAIFNLAGIVMPALMIDGEVACKWKKKNKKLLITMFKTISPLEKNMITDFAVSLWGDIESISFNE